MTPSEQRNPTSEAISVYLMSESFRSWYQALGLSPIYVVVSDTQTLNWKCGKCLVLTPIEYMVK